MTLHDPLMFILFYTALFICAGVAIWDALKDREE